MAEVDGNGPTIEIGLDPKPFNEGLESLDKRFQKSIETMQKNLDNFKKSARQGLQELSSVDSFVTSGKTGQNTTNSEMIARVKQNEAFQKKFIENQELERKYSIEAQRQRDEQIKNSKSFVLAIGALATGGMGAKAFLDFAHNTSRLETFLQSIDSKMVDTFAYKNELRKGGAEDGEIWGVLQGVSNNISELQWNNGGNLSKNMQHSLQTLAKYNPNLQIGHQTKALTSIEQLRELAKAGRAYEKANPQQTHTQVIDLMAEQTSGNRLIAELLLRSNFNFSKADMATAKKEYESLEKNKEIDREYQRLKLEFESNLAKVLANNAPEIITLLKTLSEFINKHGEAVIMTGAMIGLTGFFVTGALQLKRVLGLVGAVSGLPTVAKAGGGLASKVWEATKWGGSTAWKGGKYIVEHPGKTLKTAVKAGAIYDLTIGNITDAQATSEYDQPMYDSNGKLSWTGRRRKIEEATGGKIDRSVWSNAYYVQTKDGTYVWIDSDFYEPIENIKRRLQNKQLEPDKPSPQPAPDTGNNRGGLMGALIPQARANEVSRNQNIISGKGYRHAKVTKETQEQIAKMLRDGYRNAGMQDFNADVAIANVNRESGFDIHAVGDSGRSKGLFQFDPYRQGLFLKRYGHSIDQSTAQEQVDFHFWELKNNEKRAGEKLRRARTRNEANNIFVKDYERSFDQNADIQRNLAFMPQAQMLGRGKNGYYTQRPSLPNIALQAQQKQIMANNTKNNTVNNHNDGTYNINLHGSNANGQNVLETIRKGNTFPTSKDMIGFEGTT